MSHIDMPPAKKLYSVQIERLPMGGYLIKEPNFSGSQFPEALIAACSTMGQVLQFLSENMEPSAFRDPETSPNLDEILAGKWKP